MVYNLVINNLDLSGLTDTAISFDIFHWNDGITGRLTLPSTVQTIGTSAFCTTGISSVNFTDLTDLSVIGQWAFNECDNLTEIDLSKCTALTTVVTEAFVNCQGAKTLKLPTTLPLTIGSLVFSNCHSLAGDLVIPANVTTVPNRIFACTNAGKPNTTLRSITFQATILNLSCYKAFAGCNGLEYIDIKATTFPNSNGGTTGVTTLSRTVGSTVTGAVFSGLPTHTLVYLHNLDNSTDGLWDGSAHHDDIPNYIIVNGSAWSIKH